MLVYYNWNTSYKISVPRRFFFITVNLTQIIFPIQVLHGMTEVVGFRILHLFCHISPHFSANTTDCSLFLKLFYRPSSHYYRSSSCFSHHLLLFFLVDSSSKTYLNTGALPGFHDQPIILLPDIFTGWSHLLFTQILFSLLKLCCVLSTCWLDITNWSFRGNVKFNISVTDLIFFYSTISLVFYSLPMSLFSTLLPQENWVLLSLTSPFPNVIHHILLILIL